MLKNTYNLDTELNRPVHDKNLIIPGKSNLLYSKLT